MSLLKIENLLHKNESLIRDCSGLSGATALVVESQGQRLFRKVGVGPVAERLKKQVQWFQAQAVKYRSSGVLISTPALLRQEQRESFFMYELSSSPDWVDLHMKLKASEKAFEFSANLFFQKILNFGRPQHFSSSAKRDLCQNYFETNLVNKLQAILSGSARLQELDRSDSVRIHQRTMKPLSEILHSRSLALLIQDLQSEETFTGGHGDLTLSNVLWTEQGALFVDPNPNENVYWLSQELSKILQSTLLNYEDLLQESAKATSNEYVPEQIDLKLVEKAMLGNQSQEIGSKFKTDLSKEVFAFRREDWLRLHLAVHVARMLPYLALRNPRALKEFYYISLSLLQDLI